MQLFLLLRASPINTHFSGSIPSKKVDKIALIPLNESNLAGIKKMNHHKNT
ncbi:hypothetical protein Echvi_2761 [Echinicola vietnamensis DSM 17526]|uniref:Uncharacterized protein n=1 Tax=Echinicola vietnamensis (strain DSM 17526 / LMG 23754 / KMM 6221) TaxID=926556 RepID=L0G216_ECHVK|nr:hypothetical protein Echvi_2761 [Echinicola vietnamensis DSM 17526]